MRRRLALGLSLLAATGAAAAVAACSSSSDGGVTSPDAGGADATLDGPSALDAARPDVGADAPRPRDAGPRIEAGCSPVNTGCDLVLQDCPADQECAQTSDTTTACVALRAAQRLPLGHACCPSASPDPCGRGLRCIGLADDKCLSDAGVTGRCTPACCSDDVCGKSDPEGFAGRCSLTIVAPDAAPLYEVCDYNAPCKPFHVQPCASGFTCVNEDRFGTASCILIYNGGSSTGLGEGEPCDSENSCADGLDCVGSEDAGFACAWLCLTPDSSPPFDAGALRDAGAGYGGCPAGERCAITFSADGTPAWISACTP